MAKVVAQVHTVIDVMQLLTAAIDNKDASQLEALMRKVNGWIMDAREQEIITSLIMSVDAAIEEAALNSEDE